MTDYKGKDTVHQYLASIQGYETLTFEEEQKLARQWRDEGDRKAFDKLVKSHLRLVVKVALGFKGYGLPVAEIIQEGNIGLMHSVTRFDPDKGFRLSTYAMWWIRASIQEYVLNNWSLVKIGTTAAQKKLFFNLRKLRNRLREVGDNVLTDQSAQIIANELDVRKQDVEKMNLRMMGGDQSLNTMITGEGGSEWVDWLVDDSPTQEQAYSKHEELSNRRVMLKEALEDLDDRERAIICARQLNDVDKVPTLEDLSQHFKISRERVRQLEQRAFQKIQKHMHRPA